MIASAVAVVGDKKKRNMMIDIASKQFCVSKQTIRSLLCSYLVYQDIAALAPKQRQGKIKELTKDQKNMRWALNKFFRTIRISFLYPCLVCFPLLIALKATNKFLFWNVAGVK